MKQMGKCSSLKAAVPNPPIGALTTQFGFSGRQFKKDFAIEIGSDDPYRDIRHLRTVKKTLG